jgi:hypothetical protein
MIRRACRKCRRPKGLRLSPRRQDRQGEVRVWPGFLYALGVLARGDLGSGRRPGWAICGYCNSFTSGDLYGFGEICARYGVCHPERSEGSGHRKGGFSRSQARSFTRLRSVQDDKRSARISPNPYNQLPDGGFSAENGHLGGEQAALRVVMASESLCGLSSS